ncbi:MAG TPA: thioredoxin-like domain-containing protein [Chthoniobacterales bacterium]|nr:thioredoxin-like domain-containing protein [Chthoniobacterales bacterium]
MLRSVFFLFALLLLSAQAGQLPFTVSEIGLMLRSGYSSDSLMHELSTRHFADTVDEAKEKTLVNAGASAELISALKSGIYSLTPEKTAVVQEEMAAAEQRRAEQAEASRKSDAAYQREIARERTAKQTPKLDTGSDAVSQFLKGDLVQWRNGGVVHADDTALANKKLIAFYFSAHWCAPCRKFTPQLVDYYNRVAAQHPEFEIVFYSFDKSPFAFETYMREANMPWPAIDYAKLKGKEALAKSAGDGIPSLVLVDSSGNVISASHAGGQNFGPQKVLADLDAIFAGKAPARVASAQ